MNDNTNTAIADTQVEAQEIVESPAEKTYTELEFQAEVDRRVTSALKKQEKKNQDKIREAEKLAQMNEAEKFEYQLQQREAAIAEKERELALLENKNEASKILAEKGLSLSLVDFVVAEDAETMNTNIKILDYAFQQSVKNEVEKRLASKTPKRNLPLDKTIDKKDFMKMNTMELMKLAAESPELYEQLSRS